MAAFNTHILICIKQCIICDNDYTIVSCYNAVTLVTLETTGRMLMMY